MARWHRGHARGRDFSFETFKKLSPQAGANYQHVVKATKTGDREVTFMFDGPGNRALPQVLGQLTILPKRGGRGATRTAKSATSARPHSSRRSAPALTGSKSSRRAATSPTSACKDYWGDELNVNIGRDNFDELRFEYFRDGTVALEAFKGDAVDWRIENSAKNWATAYDFPAVTDKRVILEEFPIKNVGMMQAFAFNLRREKFQDPRVRLAFNYAFDFEEMNKQIFFGQYKRIASYFEGTDLAATGLPTGRELELLETVRDKVPADVFKKPYANPVGGSPTAVRGNLHEACGCSRRRVMTGASGKLVHAKTGEPFTVELFGNNPMFERVFLFYKPSLERLGMNVTVRTVDLAQFENRLRTWDFDITTFAWRETQMPGAELSDYYGSQAADQSGSDNVIGIKNPAVNAMIEHVVQAKNYDDLAAAAKALDRILLWNNYLVPQWSYSKLRTARWDRFSHPDPLPRYGISAFPTLWWWDAEKAAKTGGRQ